MGMYINISAMFLYICSKFVLFREENKQVFGDFSSKKKALILGAGYVSAPVVEYLTRDPDVGEMIDYFTEI